MGGTVERKCETCGEPFRTYRAWLRGGRAGRFCSRACRPKVTRGGTTIIDHVCEECGAAFQTRKGRGGTGQFCSIQCMAVARGRSFRGANHPKWRGGISNRAYSTRSAIEKRKSAVGKCERCGSADDLQGHHIESHSSVAEKRADEANILILCAQCHAAEHPELAAFILSKGGRNGQAALD